MSTYKKLNGCEMACGNLKLGTDTLIINMNAATDCPSRALGLCKLKEKCYALKAERLYKGTLPYRRRQAKYWQAHDALTIASDILNIVGRMKNKPAFVRLSGAGDFMSQLDVNKAEEVAKHLFKNAGIQMYTYSTRSDLNFSDCIYLAVKGSSHTKGNNGMTIARRLPKLADSPNVYREAGREFEVCPTDCRNCTKCKTFNGINVVFPLH